MSDNFSPTGNFAAAHLVGGVADDDVTNQLLLRLNPDTKALLVEATFPTDAVTDGEAVDVADAGTLVLGTDGSNYQILSTDSTGRLQVNVVGAGLTALQNMDTDLTTIIGHVDGIEASVDGIEALLTTIDADTSTLAGAVAGSEMQVDVVGALPAGTNLIGDIDVQPRTTGGWSVGNFTSGDTYTALTNTAQVLKASAGKFGGYYIYNPNAAATYVMIYNIAAAGVTVGTSTAKLVFCIPAASGANLEILAGIPFDTAMSIAAATTGGGNGAPVTALEAMVWYK